MAVTANGETDSEMLSELRDYTLEDEEIVYSFTHRPTGLMNWIKSMLGFGETHWFITNKRVLVYGQRAAGFSFQEVPLESVRSVEYGQAMDKVLLALGIVTLPLLVGVLFLLYAYFRRPQVLNVYASGGTNLSVKISKGDEIDDFLWYLAAQRELRKSET